MKAFLFLSLLLIPALHAGLADRVEQTSVAGLQVYACKAPIEDVVVLRGWLPAGRYFALDDNPMLATLAAGML